MMKKAEIPAEFEVREPFHELGRYSDVDQQKLWHKAQEAAELFERRILELEASFRKINETNEISKRKFLLDLIEEIMDNLDRVLASTDGSKINTSAKRWFKRIQRVQRRLEEVLAREQVTPIDMLSAPPGLVTVADVEERDDVPDGTIVAINWRGYLWKGEVLRKANVIVAQNTHPDGSGMGEILEMEERKHG